MRLPLPRHRILCAILCTVVLVAVPSAIRAVLVTPHAIFIDHRTRTAQLSLANPSAQPEEVTIDLKFGYPATDSTGTPYIRLAEDSARDEHDATKWMRAFPRQVRLEPGDRQTVRLLATPPTALPDGEYWARYIVTTRGASIPVTGGDSTVRVGLTMEVRIIGSVTYRKGQLKTGVELKNLTASVVHDSLISWMGLTRTGVAAFLGTVRWELVDAAGKVASKWDPVPLAVYYPINRRFAYPLDSIPKGHYTLQFELTSGRKDLERGQALPADSIGRSFEVEVP